MFSQPKVFVVVFATTIISIIILVKLLCAHHEIIYVWTGNFESRPFFPGEEPPGFFKQE